VMKSVRDFGMGHGPRGNYSRHVRADVLRGSSPSDSRPTMSRWRRRLRLASRAGRSYWAGGARPNRADRRVHCNQSREQPCRSR
jgi:hypothetical protein